MKLVSFLILLSSWNCDALSASSIASVEFSTKPLKSTQVSQLAVLDGGEWASVQASLFDEKALKRSSRNGYMTVVTGRTEDNQRVVAMKCPTDANAVFENSMAVIPDKVSDDDAIATYIVGLSSIHSVLPKAEKVGGSNDSVIAGKTVVLGGNDVACFAAEGLASLGVDVSLVSPGSPKVKKNTEKIDTLKPAIDSADGIGFSSYVGHFDTMLDTIGNERPSDEFMTFGGGGSDGDDDEEEDDELQLFKLGQSTTLNLLASQHNCKKYVSTVTECQMIIGKEGVFAGPGAANKYAERVGSDASISSPDCQPIPPPKDIGNTMEMLFQRGVTFSAGQRKKLHQKSERVRGWTLGDFWESTTWPRDASGSSSVRFGLPVLDDVEVEESIISTTSFGTAATSTSSDTEDDEVMPTPVRENPYVEPIVGIKGLQEEIEEAEKDCILFLSAKFCKTCKSINPMYNRMARQKFDSSSSVVFAKAEASGKYGKALGKHLGVEAVPAFVLFREGQVFGTPLSTSKLPSPKISRAIKLLESGEDWDPLLLNEGA